MEDIEYLLRMYAPEIKEAKELDSIIEELDKKLRVQI